MNTETRNYFTGRIDEELGSFISTIKQQTLGKALCETWHKITPTKRLMDLKYLILDNLWIMKTLTQIIKNDIIPPPMIQMTELHSGLQYEESLSFLEKNLDEHLVKELNPWWTIM